MSEVNWRSRAACRGVDPELFWPESADAAGLALHICRSHCPVRDECRVFALTQPGRAGSVLAGERWVTVNSRVKPSKTAYASPTGCRVCQR